MAIKATGQAEGAPETLLVGWLADQAALSGVLNALYGLHLPLLSLELVNLEEEQDGKEAARKMKRKAYERELARLEAT
jgi:hypothetical protein